MVYCNSGLYVWTGLRHVNITICNDDTVFVIPSLVSGASEVLAFYLLCYTEPVFAAPTD